MPRAERRAPAIRDHLNGPAALLLAASLALSARATAQTPAAADAKAAEVTRHYEAGVAAAKKQDWQAARLAFLEAWKRRPHYQIAAALGRAELKAGAHRDAAEHLAYFVREAPAEVSAKDKDAVRGLLAVAKAKIGTIALRVEPAGAEVLLDGAPLPAPMPDALYVEPGRRVIEARREGYGPARLELDVAAGQEQVLDLRLAEAGAAAAPGAGAAAAPGAGAAAAAAPGAAAAAAPGAEAAAATPKPAALPGPGREEEPGPAAPPGPRRVVLIGAGIGLSAAAAVTGAVLVGLGAARQGARDTICDPDRPVECSEEAASKQEWRAHDQARSNLLSAGTWSLIGAGVVGAATTAYALGLFDGAGSKRAAARVVQVVPLGAGLGVAGRW